jgi:predicted hotdog family 3-hydroxylacyl-ACP dehydratase
MLASRHDIINYIPQRAPFVMVDDLIEATVQGATTQFEILSENVLVQDDMFSEAGLVENIAQTAAAQAGYHAHTHNQPAPMGFIANIKDLKVYQLPKAGSLLTTSVKVVNQVFDMTLCLGEVRSKDEIICQCEIRVFVKPSSNQ